MQAKQTKRAIMLLANGFEEIEALTVVDLLRRGGVDVALLGVGVRNVAMGSNGVQVWLDNTLNGYLCDIEHMFPHMRPGPPDMIIVPGGLRGVQNLATSQDVGNLLQANYAKGVPIAAICAAPAFVLAPFGLLDGHVATGYPGTESKFPASTTHSTDPVVVSTLPKPSEVMRTLGQDQGQGDFGQAGPKIAANQQTKSVQPAITVITSRGVGTAIPFALQLLELLEGADIANKVGKAILWL